MSQILNRSLDPSKKRRPMFQNSKILGLTKVTGIILSTVIR